MSEADVIDSQPLSLVDEVQVPESALSLFLARSGVGKSAVLINLALDQLLAGNQVLHFTVGMTSEKTHQYYQELFNDYKRHYPSAAAKTWSELEHHFTVVSYLETENMINDLENEMNTIVDNAGIKPSLVLLDGLEANEQTAQDLGRIKAVAQEHHARFAGAMTIHRNGDGNVDLAGPVSLAKEVACKTYWLEPSPENDRINIELMSDATHGQLLKVHFCPHDFIFKNS
jgi:hypothetical protein